MKITEQGTIYRIEISEDGFKCLLAVDSRNHCSLEWWQFIGSGRERVPVGGLKMSSMKDREVYDSMQRAWKVLQDNDLISLRQIGPEDSEWFATDDFYLAMKQR